MNYSLGVNIDHSIDYLSKDHEDDLLVYQIKSVHKILIERHSIAKLHLDIKADLLVQYCLILLLRLLVAGKDTHINIVRIFL